MTYFDELREITKKFPIVLLIFRYREIELQHQLKYRRILLQIRNKEIGQKI